MTSSHCLPERESPSCLLLVWAVSPAKHSLPTSPAMASDHPDAPKQFGIRISDEVMELVSEIQDYRRKTNQPFTLAAIVENAIRCHYNRLVSEGSITDDR